MDEWFRRYDQEKDKPIARQKPIPPRALPVWMRASAHPIIAYHASDLHGYKGPELSFHLRLGEAAGPSYTVASVPSRATPEEILREVEKMTLFFLQTSEYDRDRISRQMGNGTVVRVNNGFDCKGFSKSGPVTLAFWEARWSY